MRERVQSLIDEPPVPDPPTRVWRDWVLFAALNIGVVAELVFRDDINWKVVSVVVALAILPTVLWRRTYPLAMVGLVFGVYIAINIAAGITGDGESGLYVNAFVLILVYALFRWGSGRHAAIGLGLMLATLVSSFLSVATPVGDMIGGTIILLAPAELGAIIRYRGRLRVNEVEQIKLHEREQLARELHDTVAHHVSAIAIQAQAGQTLADLDPQAAVQALATIEEEASRTLAEMRGMVGALRRGDEPDLAPQRGVWDIERLTDANPGGPTVHVELAGDLGNLGPSLDAAIYRLAQESITNATRHAKHATRVDVSVSGDSDAIHLTVSDDGVISPNAKPSHGYGLIGMAERAKLLGGSMEAGPGVERGWLIHAVLPRSASSGSRVPSEGSSRW